MEFVSGIGEKSRVLGLSALNIRRLLSNSLTVVMAFVLLLASAGMAHAAERVHIVQQGEGLGRIAQAYDVSMGQLAAYNGIVDPNHVLIGQKLTIPYAADASLSAPQSDASILPGDAGYHVVQAGDMLSQIAKRYSVPLEDLMRINGLLYRDTIYVGQKIRLTARVDPSYFAMDVKPTLADAIYVVQDGDSLAMIARRYEMTLNEIMVLNGLPNPNFVWTGQRLRVKVAPTPVEAMAAAGAPANGERWIEINLTTQTLTAWQGDVAILNTPVSTGKASTPTVPGTFHIYNKLDSQHMTGEDYDLPGVPWVMYYSGAFAIHGAYWHNSFGVPTSHGCTNMMLDEAQALYAWAPVGTKVYVRY